VNNYEQWLVKLGGRIRAERERQNLTRVTLAEMANTEQGYIVQIERGTRSPSLRTFTNLLMALGVSADCLIFGTSDNDETERERLVESFASLLKRSDEDDIKILYQLATHMARNKSLSELNENINVNTISSNYTCRDLNQFSIRSKTDVDIKFVIDVTSGMQSFIDNVKVNVKLFLTRLKAEFLTTGRTFGKVRLKVLAFRDYYCFCGDAPLEESDFFLMPEDNNEFQMFVDNLVANGGGDEPESGLEALSLAIMGEWNNETHSNRKRHIIVLFTDASAHKLDSPQRLTEKKYPHEKNIPMSFEDLTSKWENGCSMSKSGKRLVIFAPDTYPWSEISTEWPQTVFFPSCAGDGLTEVDLDLIIKCIVNAV